MNNILSNTGFILIFLAAFTLGGGMLLYLLIDSFGSEERFEERQAKKLKKGLK